MTFEAPHAPRPRGRAPSRRWRLWPACLLAAACLPAGAAARPQAAAERRCEQPARFYEEQDYVVKKIRIATVLDFLGGARRQLEAELADAQAELQRQGRGLREGAEFRNIDGYFALQVALTQRLDKLQPVGRFRYVHVAPYLSACDAAASPPSLEVVYKVFSTEPLSYATGIFEKRFDKVDRSLVPKKLRDAVGEALPAPLAGYNRSRGLFGGAHVGYTPDGGFVKKLDARVTGSGSSAEADAGLSGARDYDAAVNHLEWRLGYRYSNIPSDDVRLKEATALGQLFGATRPLGPAGVVLRFGGSVEGGNRQSDLPPSAVPDGDPASSGYGAAKMYLGGTLNRGRQSWVASYGLQLGQNRRGRRVDYVKQLVDTAYNVRLLAREHRPLVLDARLTAGWIRRAGSGGVPVAERFFGGNAVEQFIQGDAWGINAGPLIRSFPQNRLNRTGLGPPVGGENFFSANLTLAQTVWGRAAIPAEVRRDADFNVQFGAAILGLRNTIVGSDVLESAALKRAQATLKEKFPPLLTALAETLRRIPQAGLPADVPDMLSDASDDVGSARDAAARGDIRALLLGFDEVADPLLKTVRDDVEQLRLRLPAHAADLGAALAGFDRPARDVLEAYAEAQALGFVDPARFAPLLGRLPEVEIVLARVRDRAARLPAAAPPNAPAGCREFAGALEAVKVYAKTALDEAGNARADASKREGVTKTSFEKLFKGQGPLFPPRLSSVAAAARDLEPHLACVGRGADAAPLAADAELLARLRTELAREYDKLPTPELELKADRELAYTGRVLDVIFRELNIASLSPVVMFDAARVGPQSDAGAGGVRYGLGGGLRLSVVTLDLTAGYSWNLDKRAGEGRGAFVFALDVSDLFR